MAAHAFANPVFDAQRVFRAAMNALSRPGTLQTLDCDLAPPASLPAELAALALTLADHETPLWLDAALAGSREVTDYLRFHTGTPITANPREAHFALVSDPALCPSLHSFARGTPDYPDRSTTMFVHTSRISVGDGLILSGPGIRGTATMSIDPLPPAFAREWIANRALFPCGVDVLFTANGMVTGLPRTTMMEAR
jgi:alpha-D-ribose 1-methylphosphonate 5-triphosphate synthase subunit PhnH